MGGDGGLSATVGRLNVSIHAPAWGATEFDYDEPETWPVSIHAPAWGATTSKCRSKIPCRFQSTPPHGGRLKRLIPFQGHYYVSIHAPAWGATENAELIAQAIQVSIHAPAWGATLVGTWDMVKGQFQSTPPHGGRQSDYVIDGPTVSFNPRPRMGGDAMLRHGRTGPICFNPRPRMGGDEGPSPMLWSITGFNPRPRMGGDCF